MRTIVLTGGGTAGHVMPNLALLPELKKYFDKIIYIGGKGIERDLALTAGIPFFETPVVKLDRSRIMNNFKIPFVLIKGVSKACTVFDEIRPDIVFSKGGYAALPSCFAAHKRGIPVVCHESDYTLGLANKVVSSFAAATLTSFPETKGGTFVGNPVRKEIYEKNNPLHSIDQGRKKILITGGSLGSLALNEVVYNALPPLLKKYNVVHISGKKGDFSIKQSNYLQIAFTNDFPELLRSCDLVVCRSGANTLSEVASLGKKCLTIPLPKGVSRGDQILNAESYRKRGYCTVLPQEKMTPQTLLSSIEKTMDMNPPVLNVERINANIVEIILSALK